MKYFLTFLVCASLIFISCDSETKQNAQAKSAAWQKFKEVVAEVKVHVSQGQDYHEQIMKLESCYEANKMLLGENNNYDQLDLLLNACI